MWQELASFIQRKANQNLSNSGDNKDNIIQAVKHGDENLVRKLLEQDSGKSRLIWFLQMFELFRIRFLKIYSSFLGYYSLNAHYADQRIDF